MAEQQLWTEPDEVLARWTADEDEPETEKLVTKIGQAERVIRREFPTMAARLLAVDPDGSKVEPDLPGLIADVVSDLVQESFTNPLGLRTMQVTEGPWNEQRTVAGDSPGKMSLSAQHRRLLSPSRSGSRLRTIDTEAGSYAAGHYGKLHVNAHGVLVTADGWPAR